MRRWTIIFFLPNFYFVTHGQGVGSPCTLCLICNVGLLCDVSCTCVNPLPIELINFETKQIDNSVEITWTTTTETNNDFFTIERSSDGINFYEIIKVKGAGNSSTALHYYFNDIEPPAGINYYRLKQVDYDGQYKYYAIKAINVISIINSFSPNPFSTQTTLQTVNLLYNATLRADNCFGQTVAQIKNISGQTIVFNRADLASGLYFVRLTALSFTRRGLG